MDDKNVKQRYNKAQNYEILKLQVKLKQDKLFGSFNTNI